MIDPQARPAPYIKLMALVIMLGLISALVTFAFMALVHQGTVLIWEQAALTLGIEPRLFTILVCTLGGLLVGLLVKFFGDHSGIFAEVMREFGRTGRFDYRNAPGIVITAFASLVSGASLGPEAPLADACGGIGTLLSDRLKLNDQETRTLGYSGVSGMLAAFITSPFGGALLGLESAQGGPGGLLTYFWVLFPALLPGALGIALVNFAEAYGPARGFAGKHKYEIDANQELIGLGAANMGAGLFQGFAIGSSLSKSAANDRAGAKTPHSLLVCAGLTVIVALFLTPLFAPLPKAVLGAVVIVAVIGMMKFKKMRHLWDMRRVDFWLAVVALFGVLTFEALEGLLIAVIISLALLVWRASQPRFSLLGRTPTSLEFGDVAQYPENKTIPGLLIIRPNQSLFFANADALRAAIVDAVRASDPPTRAVLLDLEMTSEVDMPGAEMLAELKEKLTGEQVDLLLSRVRHPARDLLDRSGVTQQIGAENFHLRTIDGVLAYLGKYHEVIGKGYDTFVEGVRSLLVTLDAQIAQAEGREKDLLMATRSRLDSMARKVGAV